MPGRYLISQDLPPSALEGGAQTKFGRAWSGEMRYCSGKLNIRKYPDLSGYFSYTDEKINRWPKRL